MPTKDELAQRIADLIHTEELGTTMVVFPALGQVYPSNTPGLRPQYRDQRVAEQIVMWISDEDWRRGDGPTDLPPTDSAKRIEWESEEPDFYHLFDRAEYIDEGRHILFHIGEMLEPGEPPFLVQAVGVDAYQDEDDVSDPAVGWALLAKVVR